MKIVGLDLSLASTGVAVLWTGDGTGAIAQVDRVQSKSRGDDLTARVARLHDIRQEIHAWTTGSDLVVIEGLAFSSRSPHATERAGLWWLVVHQLVYSQGIQLAVVPPTTRAKYATGKGNAGKDEVLAAVVRRYPEVETRGNDEADALVLAAMGARAVGHPIDDLPKTHNAAMAGVVWPELIGEAA